MTFEQRICTTSQPVSPFLQLVYRERARVREG